MKIGIALPTAGESASAAAIGQTAAAAEQAGLDSVWTFERQLAPVSIDWLPDAYRLVFSPLESLAFAAALTSRITLGVSVLVAPLHNPATLGRSLATLDQLSEGRLVAGLGQGWMPEEFVAAGVPLSRRGAGFSEFVEALRAVWGPDPVRFGGRFYTIAESYLGPKPVQPGGPPIIVGAASDAGIGRAAAAGLGLNPVWGGWAGLEAAAGTFRAAAETAGRDPAGLPIVLRVNASPAAAPTDGDAAPDGSPEQIVEALPRLAALGVTEVFWSGAGPIEEQLAGVVQVRGGS